MSQEHYMHMYLQSWVHINNGYLPAWKRAWDYSDCILNYFPAEVRSVW